MTLVVDASVAVKWFFDEPGHASARALLDRSEALVAPSLVLIEVANVVWKRHRQGHVARGAADGVIDLVARPFSNLVSIKALIRSAARLALDLDHPIYDCLYVALAKHERARLVTADRQLARLAEAAAVDLEFISASNPITDREAPGS